MMLLSLMEPSVAGATARGAGAVGSTNDGGVVNSASLPDSSQICI